MIHMTANPLPNDVAELKRLLHAAQQQLTEQSQHITYLEKILRIYEEEKRLAKARQFGASSEKHALQYYLFDEAEQLEETPPAPTPEALIDVKPHQRRGGRKALPKDIARITVTHDLAEQEKHCACGNPLTHIGAVCSEQLDIIPAQIYVIEHKRLKYHCQRCNGAPKTAPLPAQPIPKSQASAGFLAYVATSKYADGLPLYRQCHILNRLGISYERHTLAHQMIQVGKLTQPLINLLQDKALDYPYIQMDETTTQVLKEPGKTASSESYMWVMRGGPPDQTVVTYHYDPTRRQSVPERLLAGYCGYLQTDGYQGYNKVLAEETIEGLGCWSHVRRKYTDAQKALGKNSLQSKRVQKALGYIGQLYEIEKRHKDSEVSARYQARQQESLLVLQNFKTWLDKQTINPKSKLGEAITYTLNQWPRLMIYCKDGRLQIDNNAVENKIRPFAIGRKNWLFSSSQQDAGASANLYSLIESAKANDLNEYAYLKYIFTELPKALCVEDYEKLLPWNVDSTALAKLMTKRSLNE